LAPRLEKGYHGIWEANLKTLGANVSAFISNLGRNTIQPKLPKVWPQVFWAVTPSVKWALIHLHSPETLQKWMACTPVTLKGWSTSSMRSYCLVGELCCEDTQFLGHKLLKFEEKVDEI
jgi:hypothetical protein